MDVLGYCIVLYCIVLYCIEFIYYQTIKGLQGLTMTLMMNI